MNTQILQVIFLYNVLNVCICAKKFKSNQKYLSKVDDLEDVSFVLSQFSFDGLSWKCFFLVSLVPIQRCVIFCSTPWSQSLLNNLSKDVDFSPVVEILLLWCSLKIGSHSAWIPFWLTFLFDSARSWWRSSRIPTWNRVYLSIGLCKRRREVSHAASLVKFHVFS